MQKKCELFVYIKKKQYFCGLFMHTYVQRAPMHSCAHILEIQTKNMKESNYFSMLRSRTILIFALLAALTVALPSRGQTHRRRGGLLAGDHYHFGYVSGHVGYSILDTRARGVMPVGNLGGGVGVGYEYRNSGLWANVGVQLSFHRSKLQLDPYSTYDRTTSPDDAVYDPYRGLDTQGKSALFIYDVNQTDEIQWTFLDIPVMFGYYKYGFHVGAGLKLSYALAASSRATGAYALKAMNDDYRPVIFENMPDRGYTDYPFANQQDNRLNIGVSIIGEIGYDLLSSMPSYSRLCHVMKLSFYIEYGLNNLAKGWESTQRQVVPNPNNATQATIYPYLNTVNSPSRTVPFFAGAKITYMIGGSRTARSGMHHGCMCYQ